jgi:drug/metabolite transporter (DMT)-like permease
VTLTELAPVTIAPAARARILPGVAPIAGVALVAAGAAMWGSDGALRAPLVSHWSPWTIVLYEHIILTALVLPRLVRSARAIRRIRRRAWVAVIGVGWGGSALATLAFTFAFQYGNPDVVILLQKTQPLWALGIAALALGERPRTRMLPVALVALVGTYLLSFGALGPANAFAGAEGKAALLALVAAALWGSATVFGRSALAHMEPDVLTGLRFASALPLLGVIAATQGALAPPAAATTTDWVRLALLAVISGLVGMMLYYRGLRRTPASIATFAELAFPASALVINYFVLGATVSALQLLGFAILWATIAALHWVPVAVVRVSAASEAA